MRTVLLPALCMGLLGSTAWCSTARAVDAATIARQGNGHGAVACQSCHGPDGAGRPGTDFPRLAALNPHYLHKQLDDFASGARDNPVMKPIALALTDDERHALAVYFGKLPMPSPAAKPSVTEPSSDSLGAMLATRGRWSQKLPACEQCHGPNGVGVGDHFPPLSGQPAGYLQAQLEAWKQGSRHNDPLELMKHLSNALSEQDIVAVANWFAAQPTHTQEPAR